MYADLAKTILAFVAQLAQQAGMDVKELMTAVAREATRTDWETDAAWLDYKKLLEKLRPGDTK